MTKELEKFRTERFVEAFYHDWAEFIPEGRTESFLADARKLADAGTIHYYKNEIVDWEGDGVYKLDKYTDGITAEVITRWVPVEETYGAVAFAMRSGYPVEWIDEEDLS